jgi:CreA protein
MKRLFITTILTAALATPALADQQIGSVVTNFRLTGSDTVVVQRFDDPKVPNVSCYASFAHTGGIAGDIGVATDPSEFALNCIATGPVTIPADLPQKEQVDAISASFLVKHFVLTRLVDTDKNTLIYLLISTKILHGSPANAVSAVAATASPDANKP